MLIHATPTVQALACLLIITGSALEAKPTPQTGCNSSDVVIKCPNLTQNRSNILWLKWKVGGKTIAKYTKTNEYIIYDTKNSALHGRLKLYPNGSLLIKSLKPGDEAIYECKFKKINEKMQKGAIDLQVKCNGTFTNISQDACVENKVVLDCRSKQRTNPKYFKKLTWHKEDAPGSWKAVAQQLLSNTTVSPVFKNVGVQLLGNGSLVLPRGRAQGTDTYKCDVSKINNKGRKERHQIVVVNSKCQTTGGTIKTTTGRVAMTTANQNRGTNVIMATSIPKSKAQVCGGVLSNPAGTFQTPNYPSAYPANSRCKWTINLPQDYAAINITLNQMNIEHDDDCQLDYVAIYDELENQVGCRKCESLHSSVEVQVKGRVAIIVFQSDSSVSKSGFLARYKGVLNVGNR